MKRVMLIVSFFLLLLSATPDARAAEESFSFGRFGRVVLYRQSLRPSRVVLFVSGDGGWNKGVVDMARALSSLDTAVVGININQYLKSLESSKEHCSYPAADFEALSKFVQKRLDLPHYVPPVLVGYSSGATLVYAVLAQAPPNTFQGAISMGFCPDLPLVKPLCRGSGLAWEPGPRGRGYRFLPVANLSSPWIAFQGTIDEVCHASMVEEFVKQVPRAEIVLLPKVGHGFAVQRHWMPQFKKTFIRMVERHAVAQPPERDVLTDLPLVEVLAQGSKSDFLAVIVSGDGGWAGLDREVGDALAAKGVPVVGLNSLQYFWKARTPDGASQDLARILRHYLVLWKKDRVILIGYSLGADVLPFMANRLSKDLLDQVRLIALLGPSRIAEFEFHVTEWLGESPRTTAKPVPPEVEKLRGKPILCVYGDEERESLCRDFDQGLAESVAIKGGHHFGGEYEKIALMILQKAR